MAKATRTLTNEELRGFVKSVATAREAQKWKDNNAARLARNAEARAAGYPRGISGGSRPAADDGSDWDNMLHAGGRVLDTLGALGYGANKIVDNQLDKVGEFWEEPGWERALGVLGAGAESQFKGLSPNFYQGIGDAITGNQENLKHGFELVEKTSDVAGRSFDPNYRDVQDNVDPIAKGVTGFALDVANDPLTYAPAGPGLAAVKGAFRASTGAARATPGGDLAKTGAFFNPITAGKGAVKGVQEFGAGLRAGARDANERIANFGKEPANPILEEALQTIAPRAANTAGAAAKKAPATASRGTAPAEVKIEQGVAEGARAAEATAEATAKAVDEAPVSPAAKIITEAAPTPHGFSVGDVVTRPRDSKYWTIREAADGTLEAVAKGAKKAIPEAAFRAQRLSMSTPFKGAVEEAAAKAAEKSVRTQMVEQLAPDIARAADASTSTDDILANLRGLTYTANRYPSRLAREVEKLTPLTDRKLVKEWTEQAAALVGEEAAVKLRKITDPEEFAAAAKEIARERTVNTLEGKTPTDLFRKLTSSRNEFDPAKVRQIAGLLGLKGAPAADANWKTFSDYLRRADPKAAYDELKRQQVVSRGLLGGSDIPGAAIAEASAKSIDPDGARVAAAEAADNLLTPQLQQEYDDAIAGIFPADFEKVYRYQNSNRRGESFHTNEPEFGPGVKAVSTNVFNQNHQLTLFKNLMQTAAKKFPGVSGAQRQDLLYEYVMDGLKYTDLRLRSLGIAPVNGAFGAEAKLLKNSGDHAFLSFGDVLDAMPPETVKALLLSGKDINVPITLLSDTARHALKLAESDMDSVAQATTILHTLQQRLLKEFAAGTKKDTTAWLQSPKNATILRAVAGAFTEPGTVQRLAEANVRNLAFATAVNGKKAWRAVEPIVKTLRAFALNPNVTVGTQIDAVLEARKAAESMVKATKIEGTPAEGLAETMLDVETAKATSSAVVQQARGALGQDRAVVDASGKPLTDTAKKARVKAATEATAAANAPGKPPSKPAGGAKTETAKKAEVKTREKANTARAAEHTAAHPTVEQIVKAAQDDAESIIDDPILDVDAAYAAFTMGLPGWLRVAFKGAEKMDGWFGKADVKTFAIAAEMNSQNMIHKYTRALNDVSKGHDPDAIKGAIAVFKGMDGNAGLDVALTGAPAGVAAAARSLWPAFSQVLDHSEHNLFQRVGFEGAYLNDYLRRQGVPDQFLLAGTQSWENGSAWTQWDWDAVENPLAILDNYHRAIVKAQVVPDVAANFSSQFGNKSTLHGRALSDEEARAAGWVKADTQSGRSFGLFHFLDKEQYYPREMLTQLSLMDNYFNSSRTLDENGLFDKVFRYADPVVNSLKASITLWRPGHHVTNMMGEFLMNVLAGVVNPLRYGDAAKIMQAAGKIDGETATSLERYLKAAAPEGVQLKAAENGIPIKIRGNETTVSFEQVYQLLDQSGAIIHHNQAEDLLNETFDVVGRSPKDNIPGVGPNAVQRGLRKINQTVAPGWLGRASAQRDNIFRIAHAADLLRKGSFNSVEDAMAQITKTINSFHPNMHTLGAMEQKYVRRFIYFYTWQRQALTRVLTSMIDTPGRIMIAPKALYNVSAANGADPDSWGDVVPDEGGIPDYLRGNIGQWMFHRGLLDDDLGAQENYLWGQSLNAPQLDILQSVLGSVAVDPEKPLWEQTGETAWQLTSKNIFQNLTPLFRVPMELSTHAQVGTGIPIQEGEEGQYLLNQTGLRGPLLFAGVTPADANDDPRVAEMKRENALYNWATGMRRTIYDGPEQYDIWLRQQQEKTREAAERNAG